MRVVGLTGGIGAGKSTVSALLAERGANVVDADAITRELQRPGTPVFEAMVARFGERIVGPDGELDRAGVASLVFGEGAEPDALADLNAIVHPAVGAEIANRLADAAGKAGTTVLDVPLLVESGRGDLAGIVVVDVDPSVAVDRLVEHRGFERADVWARVSSQATREDRLARADFVVDNSGDLDALEAAVDRCWEWIERLPEAADQPPSELSA